MNNKIKALLALKRLNMAKYAESMSMSTQALSNKAKRSSWTLPDMIQLADLTDTTLAFNDRETGKPLIEFTITDIEEKNG